MFTSPTDVILCITSCHQSTNVDLNLSGTYVFEVYV